MNAWVLNNIGDLRLMQVPEPVPQPGEVQVKVKCAGICSSDIARIFTAGTYSYPLIPGHEFSGELADGRRVAVFPLLPCFSCSSCSTGSYETCSSYDYIGSRRDGAFAEYVAVPEWNLVNIPDDVSYEEAALFEPAAVALHAVRALDISDNSGISCAAVVGNGVIGRLIEKWLTIEGVSGVKLFGRGEAAEQEAGRCGFDACFEAAGTIAALQRCIELVKPNGQIVLVGNPDTGFVIDRLLYWQFLRKQITVRGVWNSRYPGDWKTISGNAEKLKLKELVSHRIPFDKAEEALVMMRDKKIARSKVMLML